MMLPSQNFVSDTDAFLRDYLRAHPETVNRQKEGLRLWWEGQASGKDQESECAQKTTGQSSANS
ncbi:MAG: DUF3460 family protein [Betaproteobacteria bacterium]|nr:DUF3460 family protein [Betaproteobacteria bacterium]